MAYTLPNWVNGQPPYPNAENLNLYTNAISDLDGRATLSSTSLPQVGTISALRALSGVQLGGAVTVLHYNVVNDGGGGVFLWDAASALADDGGVVIIPNSNPGTGRWRRVLDNYYQLNVRHFGASGTGLSGATSDQAAFAAAFSAADARDGFVYAPAGNYYVTGPFTQDTYVALRGDGRSLTWINHTGDNTFVTALSGTDLFAQRSWENFTLYGNSGVSAKGIVHGNATNAIFKNLRVQGYSQGTGIELANTTTWTEETSFGDVEVRNCMRGIALTKSGAGTNSFSSTTFEHVLLVTDLAGSVGLYIGPGNDLYSGLLKIKIHLENTQTIGIHLDTGAMLGGTTHNLYGIFCEINNPPTAGYGGMKLGANTLVRGRGSIYPDLSYEGVAGTLVPFNSIDSTAIVNIVPSGGTSIISGPGSVQYYHIVTLPVSAGNTKDKIEIEILGSGWLSTSLAADKILMANRGGFAYQYWRNGPDSNRSDFKIVAYDNAGAIGVYAVAGSAAYNSALVRARGVQLTDGAIPLSYTLPMKPPVTTTPSGTVVFDSSTSAVNGTSEMGDLATSGKVIYKPTATQTISAVGNQIQASSGFVKVTAASAFSLNSTPTIPDGVDGQMVTIINVGAGAITVSDQGTVALSGLRLTATTFAMATRDNITLVYDATIGDWVETRRSNVL